MGRFAWSQVRFRLARTLALVAGVLVAATAFTVLTAASRTAQVRTTGAVSANFQPAYDILVRPRGARTALESKTGTVQADFQSGIYGGITMAQWHKIQKIPAVQVAAPIAMVGYAQLNASMFVPAPKGALAGSGRQLYRISTTYVNDNGASRVTQPPGYLYVTPLRLRGSDNVGDTPATDGTGPGCTQTINTAVSPETNPFGAAAQSYASCWSRVNQYNEPPPPPGRGNGGTEAGYWIEWDIPMLIAAIDPDAEAELDGLNKALVSGRYLKENEGDGGPTFPVLASSASGMNEYAQTTVQQLAAPSAMPDMNASWASAQAPAPGRTVATERTTAQQAYATAIKGRGPTITLRNRQGTFTGISFSGYWSVGPVDYQRTTAGALVPRQVVNPPSVWYTGTVASVAMDDEDSQYRTVTSHAKLSAQNSASGSQIPPLIKIAGVFDPARIRSFDPLSQVPLGDYQPVAAAPATAASRRALHGGDLLPNQNLGGLVSQPVNLVTTLSALPVLQNSQLFTGVHAADPISVIRVKVAGVTGPGALSRERVNEVAQQIAQRTGLDVDIVAGSSPSPVTIDLPADRFSQPPLILSENWVKEGVAVAILSEVDKTSVVLFTLILVVSVLFVGNAATAAVRGRRRELGVLAAVGWRRARLLGPPAGTAGPPRAPPPRDHLAGAAQRGPHSRPHPDRGGQPGHRHRRADAADRGHLRLPRGGRRITARRRRRGAGQGRRLHRGRGDGRTRGASRRRRGVPEHQGTRSRVGHPPQLRLAGHRAGPAGDHRGRDHRRHRLASRRRARARGRGLVRRAAARPAAGHRGCRRSSRDHHHGRGRAAARRAAAPPARRPPASRGVRT